MCLINMYIRIAFSIELRLSVSRSLLSLGNYRPFPLAQKPSNGVLAREDPITLSNTVKYHPSSNTLICTEQRGWVRNKYIYMHICITFSIELRIRVSPSLRSLAKYHNLSTLHLKCVLVLSSPLANNVYLRVLLFRPDSVSLASLAR